MQSQVISSTDSGVGNLTFEKKHTFAGIVTGVYILLITYVSLIFGKLPDNQYVIYLRDQVGRFEGNAESGYISNPAYKESKLGNGDFNSGLYCVKYPFYPFTGGYYIESDYTEIRLAEIIYSQAEALLRLGQAGEAGKLLNSVRKRNYENFTANIAYQPEGNVVLDQKEMLDEWGREFLAESRRRTDLIRFGRYQEAWWDKPRDADKHYELFPLSQTNWNRMNT